LAATSALLAVAAGFVIAPSSAFDRSVAVTSLNGQAPNEARPPRIPGQTLTVDGTARAVPPLLADAGDSAYVTAGSPITVTGIAGFGRSPYTYSWTAADGSAARFADATKPNTTFDTSGLKGPQTLRFTVTDAAGQTATDTVNVVVADATTATVLDETRTTTDPAIGGLGSDEEAGGKHYPFAIAPGTTDLHLELSWEQSYKTGVVDLRGFDLTVDDPSDREDANDSGAQFEEPETMDIVDPSPGGWDAIVTSSVNLPDTYHLTGTVHRLDPVNPLPVVSSTSPIAFEDGQAQTLTATVSGGTAPLTTAWDTDQDGLFESPGTTVTTHFPLGTSLATVKTTDAAGYEKRVVVGVRVVAPGAPTGASVVVVGVQDSGINLYHDDFSARTFPDPAISELTGNFTRHPHEYIPAFPASTPALPITLGQGYYPTADHVLFEGVTPGQLYWVPGTKVIGARDGGDTDGPDPVDGTGGDQIPILDDSPAAGGHGTASSSVAVGNVFGYCPTCLLVFNEDINDDSQFLYDQPWIDIVSNSYGTRGNVGDVGITGIFGNGMPVEAANRGQIGLYAAGNGVENGFIVPEQTYLPTGVGPGWVIRVGANDRTTRKPIVGTGKPVDVSSWGYGTIPAAGADSTDGVHNHSGTSAATPLTAGVFGTVLGAVRTALGDGSVGQRGTDAGVIATGRPIGTSSYLEDGVLTRAELQDVVLATTEHDTGPDFIVGEPTTPPYSPATFAVEGYGIAEPASAQRAIEVLLGRNGAVRPDRPDEDQFLAADHALRDELWGPWNNGGENPTAAAQQAASPSGNPFSGVDRTDVDTWSKALAVLSAGLPSFAASTNSSSTTAGSSTLSTTLTSPTAGAIVDQGRSPNLTVTGHATFPATAQAARYFPHYPEDDAGSCGEPFLDTTDDFVDSGCRSLAQGTGPAFEPIGLGDVVTEAYPLRADELPVQLAPGTVSGTLLFDPTLEGLAGVNPAHTIEVRLVATIGNQPVVLGSQEVDDTELTLVGVQEEATAYPFAFDIDPALLTGRATALSFDVIHHTSTVSTMRRGGDVASYVDVPLAVVEEGAVDVRIDGGAPTTATLLPSGAWSASVPIGALPDGDHVVSAVARTATATSAPASATITLRKAAAANLPVVQVQVVPAGGAPTDTGWVDASDTSAAGDLSRWRATLNIGSLKKNANYQVLTRLVGGGATVTGSPVTFRKG
jgi:hypothetical protein